MEIDLYSLILLPRALLLVSILSISILVKLPFLPIDRRYIRRVHYRWI